jgi:tetratricopeptide (TPR) repeat protein
MEEQLEAAESCIDVGKYEKAVEILTALIESENDVRAYQMRGYAYYCLNDFEAAIPDLEFATANDPEADLANYYLAQMYSLMMEYVKAKEYIQKAVALNHENMEYIADYITIEQSLKNYQASIELCNQLLNEIPDSNFAYNARGLAYMSLGDLDRAVQDFAQAIKENSVDFTGFNNLGAAYIRKGDYEKAYKALQASLRLYQHSSETYINIGYLLYKKGDYDTALKYIERALSIDIGNSNAFKYRGIIKLAMNETAGAKADLLRALELGPGDSFDEDINELLQRIP